MASTPKREEAAALKVEGGTSVRISASPGISKRKKTSMAAGDGGSPPHGAGPGSVAEADDAQQAEEMARYRQYKPQKLQSGKNHPDHIVESSSLATAVPPDIYYDASAALKWDCEHGTISNAQMESVLYVMQRFSSPKLPNGQRPGFLLGDAAGVGKGRQISSVIKEMWLKGTRRILWLSHSNDLREDARRDMHDCHITVANYVGRDRGGVQNPTKVDICVWPNGNQTVPGGKKKKLSDDFSEGVLFGTYSLLVAGTGGLSYNCLRRRDEDEEASGDRYNQIVDRMTSGLDCNRNGKPTRFRQIREWLQEDESESGPLIILDECHKAKNLLNSASVPTVTGVAVKHLQDAIPDAAVLYSSATGMSEPYNMAYMSRLGTFGHSDMVDLIKSIDKAGLGASELFSCSLKSQGIYVARQLSYEGAEFELRMIDLDPVFQVQYARAAAMWQLLHMVLDKGGCWALKQKNVKALFWADHQRFFKSMLMAAKVPALAEEATRAIRANLSVVIGLQSTGEGNLKAEKLKHGSRMADLVSVAKVQMSRCVDKYTANSPDGLTDTENGCLRDMSGVVAAFQCFAEYMLGDGTALECSKRLLKQLRDEKQQHRAALQAEIEEKKRRRDERRLQGVPETAEDLEDLDVPVDDAVEDNEAHHKLLSCVSLSKVLGDYAEECFGEPIGKALHALITNHATWMPFDKGTMEQVEMEKVLNKLYARLVDEQQRRRLAHHKAKHQAMLKHYQSKLASIKKAVRDARAAQGAFEARVAAAAGDCEVPVPPVDADNTSGHAVDLEDSDAGDMEQEIDLLDPEDSEAVMSDVTDTAAPDAAAVGPRAAIRDSPEGGRRQRLVDTDDEDDEGARGLPAGTATAQRAPQQPGNQQLLDWDDDADDQKEDLAGAQLPVLQAPQRAAALLDDSDEEALTGDRAGTVQVHASPGTRRPAVLDDSDSEDDQRRAHDPDRSASIGAVSALKRPRGAAEPEDAEAASMDGSVFVKAEPRVEDLLAGGEACTSQLAALLAGGNVDVAVESSPAPEEHAAVDVKLEAVEASVVDAPSPTAQDDMIMTDIKAERAGSPASERQAPEISRRRVLSANHLLQMAKTVQPTRPAKKVKQDPANDKWQSSAGNKKASGGSSVGVLSAAAVLHMAEVKPRKRAKTSTPAEADGLQPDGNEGGAGPSVQIYEEEHTTAGPSNVRSNEGSGGARVRVSTVSAPARRRDESLVRGSMAHLAASRRHQGRVRDTMEKLEETRRKVQRLKEALRNGEEILGQLDDGPEDEERGEEGRSPPRGRNTRNSRMRGLDELVLPNEDGSGPGSDPDSRDSESEGSSDEEQADGDAGPRQPRLKDMKDMRRVIGDSHIYDYDAMLYDGKGKAVRRKHPHPVTVKAKVVLKKIIDLLELPPNPLDHLTHLCGGKGVVAEMTGRKEVMTSCGDGSFHVELRADNDVLQEQLNITERNRFQDGEKRVAIISEAASTGISLQADCKRGNRDRRLHLTLELPWSADKAIQQFGRSHRSNQVSAPVYSLLMTPAAGEYRFASSAAKRLQSLGALLKGNRQALGAGHHLKEFDIDHQYGRKAMNQFLGELTGRRAPYGTLEGRQNATASAGWRDAKEADEAEKKVYIPQISPPKIPEHLECPNTLPSGSFMHSTEAMKTFFNCARTWCAQAGILDRRSMEMIHEKSGHVDSLAKLLNRLLGMNLQQQQIIFGYLQQLIDIEIEKAKNNGVFDNGVMFLERGVQPKDEVVVWRHPNANNGDIRISTLDTDQGLSFRDAMELLERNKVQLERHGSYMPVRNFGFYVRRGDFNRLSTGKDFICLVTGQLRLQNENHANFKVLKRSPWWHSPMKPVWHNFKAHWRIEEDLEKAEELWDFWFGFTEKQCLHNKPCKNEMKKGHCKHGNRQQRIKVLHGSLLHAWNRIVDVCQRGFDNVNFMQGELDDLEFEDEEGQLPATAPDGTPVPQQKARAPRAKRVKDGGNAVEMVSSTFKEAGGAERRITGLYVRPHVFEPLCNALRAHQEDLERRQVDAGLHAVHAQLRAARDDGLQLGNAAVLQQAQELLDDQAFFDRIRNNASAAGPSTPHMGGQADTPRAGPSRVKQEVPARTPAVAAQATPSPSKRVFARLASPVATPVKQEEKPNVIAVKEEWATGSAVAVVKAERKPQVPALAARPPMSVPGASAAGLQIAQRTSVPKKVATRMEAGVTVILSSDDDEEVKEEVKEEEVRAEAEEEDGDDDDLPEGLVLSPQELAASKARWEARRSKRSGEGM